MFSFSFVVNSNTLEDLKDLKRGRFFVWGGFIAYLVLNLTLVGMILSKWFQVTNLEAVLLIFILILVQTLIWTKHLHWMNRKLMENKD